MFSTYNIIVRYSYVYNQRIVLNDFSDESIRSSARAFTSVVSGIMCLVTYMLDMKADQYLSTVEQVHKTPFYKKTNFVPVILAIISLVINVILYVALKRHSANLDEHSEEETRTMVKTMKKIFAVLSFLLIIVMLRAVTSRLDMSPFVVPTLLYIFFCGVLAGYIVNKDPLRKFVKKKLINLFRINVICSSNSVMPMLA